MRTRAQAKEAAAAGEADAPAPKRRGRARTELASADTTRDELVAEPGIGQFVRRARFGEELKPATATAA